MTVRNTREQAISLLKLANKTRSLELYRAMRTHGYRPDEYQLALDAFNEARGARYPVHLSEIFLWRDAAVALLEEGWSPNKPVSRSSLRPLAVAILNIAIEAAALTLHCDGFPAGALDIAYEAVEKAQSLLGEDKTDLEYRQKAIDLITTGEIQ